MSTVLVIGAGIAGMQSALSIAAGGHDVILLDRLPSIGGRMAGLSETFPTLDCAQCILAPKMAEVAIHDRIRLLTYSEVEASSGSAGDFKVRIRRKAAYVDWSKCNGCGLCAEKCPVSVPSEFDRGLGARPAVYKQFPQAVPNKVVIDRDNCLYLQKGKCGLCRKVCAAGAVDYEQQERTEEVSVGAIVVATGYDLYPVTNMGEYGAGRLADVMDGLAFERLLSASGPTDGVVRRPSDGAIPRQVAFIKCVGSRDPERHFPYCSAICCLVTAKHASLYKHRTPEGQAHVFYMDVRAAGKGYDEFVCRATDEAGANYLRGRVAKVYAEDGQLVVCGVDTVSGKNVELRADLVVLAMAMRPADGVTELARALDIELDQHGFAAEAHPKLRPVESSKPGIFLAGCAQAPRDIPETIAHASAAAAMVCASLPASPGRRRRERQA